MHSVLKDPRYFQILTLSILAGLQVFWADFGPEFVVLLVTFPVVLIAQFVFSKIYKVVFDFRSPLITGLSLVILLKASALWVFPLVGALAIASKFLIRLDNRHIFNPANIGIVAALLVFPDLVWISPGQWGNGLWLGVLLACLALLVLFRIPRWDMGPMFFGMWAAILFGRALWLGDPLSIPVLQLQSGALLIFSFFMISDPKTIPDRFIGRTIFAFAVCVVAYILTFEFRVRESLFYALALVCLVRPLIDWAFKGERFQWDLKGENL